MVRYAIAAAAMLATGATQAGADVKIDPFSADMFAGCVQGNDIGVMTGVSNPLLLLGSVVYTGKILMPNGAVGTGLVRQPLSLPLLTTEAVTPDISSCERNFRVAADGNIAFLGFALTASRSDVYKVRVSLITRQRLAPVPEDGASVQPWLSDLYRPQFRKALAAADRDVERFWLFDNVSIYLLNVEKYRKVNAGLAGAFGLVSGGASYAREDDFRGTKIIVTGDAIPLARATYAIAPTQLQTVVAPPSQAVRGFTASEAASVGAALAQSAPQ